MAVKFHHSNQYTLYFCTFICFDWLPLFQITNSYDLVYKWFTYLRTERQIEVVAFVIMPNHLHCIIYFPNADFDLNKIIGNAKRFMAYTLVTRLTELGFNEMLDNLGLAVSQREIKKGQKHKVFEESFDAKAIFSQAFLNQKLEYIHHNPVNGKWNLASNFIDYEHSSASFYELGIVKHYKPMHYIEI